MDKELKEKWVAALRGGEFTQCRNQWHRDDGGYCCVGVLLAITGNTFEHPRTKAGVLGLPNDDDKALWSVQALIDLNDRQEKTFAEIADYIEEGSVGKTILSGDEPCS